MRPRALYSNVIAVSRSRVCSGKPAKISWHATTGRESRDSIMADERAAMSDSRPEYLNRPHRFSPWEAVPKAFRDAETPLPQPWADIFGPLRHGRIDDLVLVGQCGQSIDARIATPSGHSHYINGDGGLDHLHR